MENIKTLLAAVAHTQGFDDDDSVVSSTLENSESKTVRGEINGSELSRDVSGDAGPPLVPSTSAVGHVVGGGYRRKRRGRPAKPQPTKRRKVEDEDEDVCFICFDGGSLVLCDRKGCPKAYHPACIKRDESFFQSKAKWNCGWHICSACRKVSHYMCYTCTYSLCKACTKDADYVCVRGNKGFCSTCMKIIMLIENKDQSNNESVQVDFDDQRNWEYLFKWYWVSLKERLSLTINELTQAKRPWKGVPAVICKPQSNATVDGTVYRLPRSMENLELNRSHAGTSLEQNDVLKTVITITDDFVEKQNRDKKEYRSGCPSETVKLHINKVVDEPVINKATKHAVIEKDLGKPTKDTDNRSICKITENQEVEEPKIGNSTEWASKGLLEFVALMRNGDTSTMSQFDVQTLLLEYIKIKNLRDPHQKSQIMCDLRLKNLFGKPRVGHFEMLKLLESHFLNKEDEKSNIIPAGFVRPVTHDVEDHEKIGFPAPISTRKRKVRKKSEEREPQQNQSEYAAIDAHTINLIYLRRNLMENLLEDQENFNNKVIDSIVRIKTTSNDQKQDVYRLVQVVGTSKVAEPYQIGERTTNIMLEVLNLDKKEILAINAISDQEFTEDECRRLRQSIRCGLVKQFTVGEVKNKAMTLKSARINDWLEAEIARLSHLRDRASENGRIKQLREYIDKVELLKSPEEHQRRIAEVPEIHADPKMSPNYESEEDTGGTKDYGKCARGSYSGFSRNGIQAITPNKKGKIRNDRCIQPQDRLTAKTDASGSHIGEKHTNKDNVTAPAIGSRDDLTRQRSGLQTSTASVGNSQSANNMETEKLWHYRDPNGKIQGPFSIIMLRKWSTTGLFPLDLRIWTNHEQYDSLLLTDVLNGHLGVVSKLGSQEYKTAGGIEASEVKNSIVLFDKNSGCTKENALDASRLHSSPDLLMDDNSRTCVRIPKLSDEPSSESLENRTAGQIGLSEVVSVSPDKNSACKKENALDSSRLQSSDLFMDDNSRACVKAPKMSDEPSSESPGNKTIGGIGSSEVMSVSSDKNSACKKGNAPDASRLRSSDLLMDDNSRDCVRAPKLSDEPSSKSSEKRTTGVIGLSEVLSVSSDKNSGCKKGNARDTSWLQSWDQLMEDNSSDSDGELNLSNKPSLKSLENRAEEIGTSKVTHESDSSDKDSGCMKESARDMSWLHSWDLLKHDNASAADAQVNSATCEQDGFSLLGRGQDDNKKFNHSSQNGGKSLSGSTTQNWMTSETQCNNEDTTVRLFEGNLKFQSIDLNSNHMESGSVVATVSMSPDLSKQVEKTTENQLSISDILDLPNPTPNQDQGTETKQFDVLDFPAPELGVSWSGASGLTVGDVQLPDIGDEWCGVSPTPVGLPVREWDSAPISGSSLKPEVVNEHVSTSGSDGHQIMHNPQPNPPNITNWLEILNGPIEFDALGEEYLSDLLAEVDAMESQGAPLPSPTSAPKFSREFLEDCRDDCFSSIGDFSPAPDPQKCEEMQYSSQSSAPTLDTLDSFKRSSTNSYGSSVGETNMPVCSADAGSEFHPSEPNNEMVGTGTGNASDWGTTVQGNINLVTVQGNVNLVLGGPGQGMTNLGWGTNPGTGWVNPNINCSSLSVSLPWDGQCVYNNERYISPRERGYQGNSELGFGRGRPPRGRQPFSGGGYSRAPPRGQRVCKFYESGRCKKGAYCDYLHP